MKRWILGAASAVVGCLVACSSGTVLTSNGDAGPGSDAADTDAASNDSGTNVLPIAAKDYDQSCTVDTDCALVTEGDACAICSCQNAAVAKTALDAFTTKRMQLLGACGPRPAIGCGVDCISVKATCTAAGKCTATTPTAADGG